MSKSKNFIFEERDGELVFVGDFEGYYRDSDDPWEQSATQEMGRYYRLSRERLLGLIGECPNRADILEVGCGHGHVSRLIAERFPQSRVSGLDLSTSAVEKAAQLYPELAFVNGNIAAQDIVDRVDGKQFGVVILNQLLWYILDELPAVLANVRRLLTDDGRLIVSNAFAREQRYGTQIIDHFDGAARYFREAEGLRLLKARFDDDGEEHDDGHFLLGAE